MRGPRVCPAPVSCRFGVRNAPSGGEKKEVSGPLERKKRNILVVLIAIVIVVAMLSSFGLALFAPDTSKIVLPTPLASEPPEDGPGGGADGLVRVEVTPQTVQNVIRTLARPESYYREVTIEDIWGEGEEERGVTSAQVWADYGWTYTRSAWPGGTVRCSLVGEGTFWLWYEGSRAVLSGPADAYSADLEGQRIPTYEDVLDLPVDAIAATGYEEQGGLSCICVETAADELGYRQRYWISVDSGLLVCSETLEGEQTVYRMSSYAVERPVPAGTQFALPDGTVLHTPGGAVTPGPAAEEDQG